MNIDRITISVIFWNDVTVEKANNEFSTSIFRKKNFTDSGLIDILMSYKISSITTLINKAFIVTSSYALFRKEIEYIRNYFT